MTKPDVLIFHKSDEGDKTKVRRILDEDSIYATENVFAVFDGVSLYTEKDDYPNPSPVKELSEIATHEAVSFISHNLKDYSGDKLIYDTFVHVNKKIKGHNYALGLNEKTIDHLVNQYLSVTCAFGFIKDNILWFGQINDCGIMVFDPLANREVDFIANQSSFLGFLNDSRETKKFEKDSGEEHVFVRNSVVNNPDFTYRNKPVNFGVLNGDERALKFVRIGASNILRGQLGLFYSDGFIPYVYDREFIKLLFEDSPEELVNQFITKKYAEGSKYGKEKSLIILKF